MPTYSYLCGSCGPFELYQPFEQEALKTCPKCGGKVHKVYSISAIFQPGRALMERADKAAEYDAKHPVKRGQWAVPRKPALP